MAEIETVVVGGITTACVSRKDMVRLMIGDCFAARNGAAPAKLIFDINGQGIAMSRSDADFRETLAAADMIHADGQAVVIASRYLTNSPIPERSATTDFFYDATEAAAKEGLRVYLLGGTEEVSALCVKTIRQQYPDVQIVGRRNGYFDRSEEAAVCEEIESLNVDLLWVGLGKPNEQAFCVRNKSRLRAGWVVTCGGCYNFVVGAYPRAPQWIQDLGFEWLHRLATRPKQLAWRYLTTNPVAIFMLLTQTRNHSPRIV